MLDFFWFWRVLVEVDGRQQATMVGLNLGEVQSTKKIAHLFVLNGHAANDSDMEGGQR